MLSYFFQHSAASTSDQLWWPFPELNDDSLEMAVRHGDLCEEDDKDWPFPELNGDSFEIAVRRGDFQSEEESWPEACASAFSEGEDEPMPMWGGGASGEQDLWELKKRSERLIKKYGVKEFDFTFRPSKRHIDSYEGGSLDVNLQRLTASMDGLVPSVIREANLPPGSLVGITMQSKQLNYPIRMSWMPVEEISQEKIAATFERVMQSHNEFVLDDDVAVNVVTLEDRRGGGRVRRKMGRKTLAMEENLRKDQNLLVPPADDSDQMCLARCLVFGMLHQTDGLDGPKRVRRSLSLQRNPDRWTIEATALCGTCDVDPKKPCGTEELKKFAHLLPKGYLIRAYASEMEDQCFFKEREEDYDPEAKILHLVLIKGHYLYIRNITTYFGKRQFCEACNTPFNHRRTHRCPFLCEACKDETCTDRQAGSKNTKCDTCKRNFYGSTCLQNHLDKKTRRCHSVRLFCDKCKREYLWKKGSKHVCGGRFCAVCQKMRKPGHKCFVQVHEFPLLPKGRKRKRPDDEDDDDEDDDDGDDEDDDGDQEPSRLVDLVNPLCPGTPGKDRDNRISMVFFDIETQQESGVHIPTLLISQTTFGDDERIFEGENCVVQFLEYLANEHNDVYTTIVAHNFRGFDGHFVLRTLLDAGESPDVVMNGCKILSLIWREKLRFIDSLSFVQASLAQFPKMFGLTLDEDQSLLAKGFFCHLFHTKANVEANYVGPMPPKEMYDPDGMSPDTRTKFDAWYEAKVEANHVFKLPEELIAYCQNDVVILRKGVVKFCQDFQRVNNVNPMKYAITLASICNKVYRADHMPPDTISFVPANGYTPQANQSIVALEWLLWLNEQPEWAGHIRHVWNGGEKCELALSSMVVSGMDAPSVTKQRRSTQGLREPWVRP